MLPSLSSLRKESLRIKQAPTSVRLTESDTVAHRSDPDHVKILAVLAYSNKWDRYINAYVTNKLTMSKYDNASPFLPEDVAQGMAGVFAIFCPMHVLKRLLQVEDLSESEIRISLGSPSSGSAEARRSCRLRLVEPSRNATGRKLHDHIVHDVLAPAIRDPTRHARERREFEQTLAVLSTTLLEQAEPIGDLPVPGEEIVLWHGCTVTHEQADDLKHYVENLSTQGFVSTSRSMMMALEFTDPYSAEEDGLKQVMLRIVIDPDVRVIDHYKVLTENWRGHLESEVTLVPGCRYETLRVKKEPEGYEEMCSASIHKGGTSPTLRHVRVSAPTPAN